MKFDHPWADSSRAPLYVVELRPCSDDALSEYLAAAERFCDALDPEQRIGLVVDSAQMSTLSARQRRLCSEHSKRVNEVAKRSFVGIGLVIKSPLIRGALTAITWVAPMPCPLEVFRDRDSAVEWVTSRLRADDAPQLA